MAADAVATVRAWYATRDPGLLAEDILWRVLPNWPAGGDWHGRGAVVGRFFPALLAPFDEYGAEAEEVLPLGEDRAVSLGWYRGRGPGGPFEARFAHFWTVREGRIARFEQVADTLAVGEALWREARGSASA